MRVLEERGRGPGRSTPSAARRFADALLGRTTAIDTTTTDDSGAVRPLASRQLRLIEHFRWLMAIMPARAGLYQQQLEERLAEEESVPSEWSTFASLILEAEWDASKHPRRGAPPNGGWFADKGTGTTATGRARSNSPDSVATQPPTGPFDSPRKGLLAAIGGRNRQLNILTGGSTKATKQAQGLAADIEAAAAATAGFSAGLKTGGKAVVNGSATAIKNVATLGLSTSQLELIGVTDEDRANGYDTAVAIATASGEVLITVGTAGVAGALSKGGTVARAASGALVAYDAAGNAVGVVQGIYDAATAGVSVRNAATITANALGLTVNVKSLPGPKPKPKPSGGRGGRYGHLEDPDTANSGKDFSASQKKAVLAENNRQNSGKFRDDQTGEELVPPQQRKRGVPAPPNEAQVDHVYPKSKGGPNTFSNAEVRSRINNQRKGDRIE